MSPNLFSNFTLNSFQKNQHILRKKKKINLVLIQLTNIKYMPSRTRCYGKVIQRHQRMLFNKMLRKDDFLKASESLGACQEYPE